jgi:uncharacterized membrane protein YphA (DoxX/SURF4 family)
MKTQSLIEIIAILLAILFVYTGISKVSDSIGFKLQFEASPILKPIAPLVAGVLPILEILVSIILLIPSWRLIGLYSSLILLTAFTIYVVALISMSDELPCTCGGITEQLSWPQHIILNSVFIVFNLAGLHLVKKNESNKQIQKQY